ncbi:MAG: NUDIX domain-containing protein [Acidobacteriales bacterium]|nr:NUDIX domain-containing protein [Terriglobales bacterium]
MVREFSAGGVVIRHAAEGWECAVIEPHKESAPTGGGVRKKAVRQVLALPKGLIDPGEKAEQTAIREVFEETGLTASTIAKLIDTKYVYVRSWSDNERVFKIVSFFLLRYQGGEIDDVKEAMRIEVKRALWIPLDDAVRKLAYKGERDVARLAQQYVASHGDL